MSVYTTVTLEELNAWLARHSVGVATALHPIRQGIENTNYFVDTTGGRFVLTLYERVPVDELPFYLGLMAHLARGGIRCPAPQPDLDGALFGVLNGKPAALLTRLEGNIRLDATPAHCESVGDALARLHVASSGYAQRLDNRRGLEWRRQTAQAVRPFVGSAQTEVIAAELAHEAALDIATLPRGAIHGDLFRDNVLWDEGGDPGIIDFGFAATDAWAYDLAITVNDWCIERGGERHGELDDSRLAPMLRGYHSRRPLGEAEKRAWPSLLRAAALRFWLSRLYDLHLPRSGDLVHAHDPTEFERILMHRIRRPAHYPSP